MLTRYPLAARLGEATVIASLSLLVHPLVVYAACQVLAVEPAVARSAVLMAAMPPGVNAYLFAAMYGRGEATAAATVLLATQVALFSFSAWLWLLR